MVFHLLAKRETIVVTVLCFKVLLVLLSAVSSPSSSSSHPVCPLLMQHAQLRVYTFNTRLSLDTPRHSTLTLGTRRKKSFFISIGTWYVTRVPGRYRTEEVNILTTNGQGERGYCSYDTYLLRTSGTKYIRIATIHMITMLFLRKQTPHTIRSTYT